MSYAEVDGAVSFSLEIPAVFTDVILSSVCMSAHVKQVCLFLISTLWSP